MSPNIAKRIAWDKTGAMTVFEFARTPFENCMPEDYFKLILYQSKSNFRRINNPPAVVYNPKKRTVSVRYDFALGLIKGVKIIAPCSVWLDFWHRRGTNHISFDILEPCLYRPSKDTKKALELYSRNYPGSFGADILDCVKWSQTKIPLKQKRVGKF